MQIIYHFSWPPSEHEYLSRKMTVPHMTNRLLENILSNKAKKSSNVGRLVSSIGQDLLYQVNRGRKQTSKHTTLSFLIKCKTGSKQLIILSNKFGHGISYDDEVLMLETSLAIEQSQHQVHRSFTPANIQPSIFVTFIWDNNDINPESLEGKIMHCTNGIIIQLSSSGSDSESPSPMLPIMTGPKPKKKLFQPMPNVTSVTCIPLFVNVLSIIHTYS